MKLGGDYVGVLRGTMGPDSVELHPLGGGSNRLFAEPADTALLDLPLYITASEMLLPARYEGEQTLLRVQLEAVPTVE